MSMKWFVVHTYSGFEDKVKLSIEEKVKLKGYGNKIGRILVPKERVITLKGKGKRESDKKFYPGYILIEIATVKDVGSAFFNPEEFTEGFVLSNLIDTLKADGIISPKKNILSVESLNRLLKDATLYEKILKAKGQTLTDRLRELEKTFNADRSNEYNLMRLNRAVLEEFYPDVTPKSKNETYKIDDETMLFIKNTMKVTGFVGGSNPVPVSDEEIELIVQQIEKGPAPVVQNQFYKNDQVRIIDGPFTNFVGVIDEVDVDHGRVKVMVSIFGRQTPVELSFNQVEKN